MKKVFILLAVVAATGLAAGGARADQSGPMLLPADLEQAVAELPLKVVVDPVASLQKRLNQLERRSLPTPEQPALVQALDIIRLTRTIRLTTAERPLLAGL